MQRIQLVALFVFALGLGAVACGDDSEDGGEGGESNDAGSGGGGGGGGDGCNVEVDIDCSAACANLASFCDDAVCGGDGNCEGIESCPTDCAAAKAGYAQVPAEARPVVYGILNCLEESASCAAYAQCAVACVGG